MCIPPSGIEPAPFFALLEALADENNLGSLSMGMSSDYETAIMLGATLFVLALHYLENGAKVI